MHQEIFESETFSLNYYKTERLIELIWKKNPRSDEFRTAYDAANLFAQSHKTLFFLSDMRKEGLTNMDDLKWLVKEIIPAAIKVGVKRIALVSEENFYSALYAETLKKKLENSLIQVRIFADVIEAKAWLMTN
jgi:hypothetical protein